MAERATCWADFCSEATGGAREGMMLFESAAAAAEAFLNQRSAGLEQEFDHANHHTAYLMCTPL